VTLRDPLYRETAHWIVETGRQPVDQVVDVILARLAPTAPAPVAPPPDAP
jgi:shikimate kinase